MHPWDLASYEMHREAANVKTGLVRFVTTYGVDVLVVTMDKKLENNLQIA